MTRTLIGNLQPVHPITTASKGRRRNRVPTVVGLILGIVLWGNGWAAGRSVDETRPAVAQGFVNIDIVRGRLVVEGWENEEIRITGELDEMVEEFIFDVRGDETDIAVRLPKHTGRSGGSDLRVRVPAGSLVEVRAVSTDVVASDIRGGLNARAVSGDFEVSRIGRHAELESVSGDLRLRSSDGRIRMRSVSGEIEGIDLNGEGEFQTVSGSINVETRGEDVDVGTVSGDVDLRLSAFSGLSCSSVSGDIEVDGELMPGGEVDVDSVSGRVEVALPASTSARVDLESRAGGSIRNYLSEDEPKVSRYTGNSQLKYVLGNGDGQVTVRTASGRIVLNRR